MKRAKSRFGKACVTAPVILLIATSVVLGQWSQPAVEIAPWQADPNLFGGAWGSVHDANFPGVWFAGWDNPYQCRGDADGKTYPPIPVNVLDVIYLHDHWHWMYGDPNYDPNADFTRDGRINYLDLTVMPLWFMMSEEQMPADCPAVTPWAILLSDDFRVMNEAPVTSVHWWGGYFNWDQNEPPAILPQSWQIGFWSDAPDPDVNDNGWPMTCSRPGTLLKKVDIPAGRVSCARAGISTPSGAIEDYRSFTVFEYAVDLDATEVFQPAEFPSPDGTYWLSIMAVYAPEVNAAYPWGWFSRPWSWMDASVRIALDSEPQDQMVVDQNQTVAIRNYPGWSVGDMGMHGDWGLAFELGTEPNRIKWEQGYTGIREWASYKGVVSCGTAAGQGQIDPCTILPADDWLCQGTNPVTGIVWWGSYIGYKYDYANWNEENPYDRPNHFLLSIWTDVQPQDPCGFSHPGHRIWQYKATAYDEVMVGYSRYPDSNSDPCEPVFRYSVELPEPNWFYQRDVNGVFWLRVAAVFNQAPAYQWGWTNHQHVFNDYAVTGEYRIASPGWTKMNDDMSFVLLTHPEYCSASADYNYDCIVDYEDLSVFTYDWLWSGPAGGCRSGDLDCDGDVEFIDLVFLAEQWLSVSPDQTACPDIDGDGYGRPGSRCCPHCQRDCDDADASVHPGATEICNNGKDDDCDGFADCNDIYCGCTDDDGDGFGATATPCCPFAGLDCNDSDPNINPGTAEVCNNGLDDDCDGLTDCNDPGCDADFDNDGYCEVPGPCCQYAEADCNDRDPAIHPGAAEVCDNGKDDDCDGLIDCADGNCFCADNDGDGYGNPAGPCCQYAGLDCNDADPNVHPGATEICTNGIDDDCDGQADCADSDCACADLDGDGYGDPPGPCCAYPEADCNDNDPNVNPGRSEVCNDGKDNDCDGFTDCDDSNCACIDADGDGYGNPANSCCPYAGLDCNDNDANVFPGATELCKNGIDDDCDGLTDCDDGDCTGDPNCPTWPACWSCPTQCHGDADCDGYVGTSDLSLLQAAWLKQYPQFGYDPCADFNRDGRINTSDMSILTAYFGTSPPADCTPGGTWPPSP